MERISMRIYMSVRIISTNLHTSIEVVHFLSFPPTPSRVLSHSSLKLHRISAIEKIINMILWYNNHISNPYLPPAIPVGRPCLRHPPTEHAKNPADEGFAVGGQGGGAGGETL